MKNTFYFLLFHIQDDLSRLITDDKLEDLSLNSEIYLFLIYFNKIQLFKVFGILSPLFLGY
jgi:hypothetical protein